MADEFGGKIAKGAAWMIVMRLADRGIGFLSTLIIARLLVPEDYGLVAKASAVILMLELFKAFGFDMALIQRRETDRAHYDTTWTFNVLAGLGIALVMAVIAKPVATFYEDKELYPVLLVLSLGSFISGFDNVGVVDFRKKLQFRTEFLYAFYRRIAGFLFTVILAFVLRGYWALVIGTVLSRVVGLALSFTMHPYRPRFSLAASRDLLSFSGWILATNVTQFANSYAATFLLGKTAGNGPLGLFNMADQVSKMPTSELVAPVNRAVFPAYAAQADNESVLKASYIRVMQFFAVLGIPISLGIAVTAPLLVPVMLSPKWRGVEVLLPVLAIHGLLVALGSNNHYLYLARGKSGWTTILGTTYAAMLLPTLIYSSLKWGAIGAAWAYLLTQAVFTPIYYAMVRRVLPVTVWDFVAIFRRPAIAGAVMYAAVFALLRAIGVHDLGRLAELGVLVAVSLCGAIVYTGALLGLWALEGRPAGAERDIVDRVRDRIRSWRAP